MTTLTSLLMTLGMLLGPPPLLQARAVAPPPDPVAPASRVAPAQEAGQAAGQTAGQAAQWPLEPRPEVVAGFDPPEQTWSAGHRGVDLLGAPDQPVLAALAGTVSFAGTVAGRGVVSVDHGGRRTTYEPVRAAVSTGDRVEVGTTLGFLQTGRSHCAPRVCLHWGLVEGEVYLDPLGLLGQGPVRLLPLG